MSAAFGHATIQRGRFERRHVRCGRTWRRLERAHREVFEGRDVHQSVGKERHGSRRLQCCLSWEDLSHTHACSPFRSAGFDTPHAVAIDSKGRLFVADRNNNRYRFSIRTENFWKSGKQFGRPSGIFIDAKDTIYVADSQSDSKTNPGLSRVSGSATPKTAW
jgi:hypothetical protein